MKVVGIVSSFLEENLVGISLFLSPVDKIYIMTGRYASQDILLSGGENNMKMLLKTVFRYPY